MTFKPPLILMTAGIILKITGVITFLLSFSFGYPIYKNLYMSVGVFIFLLGFCFIVLAIIQERKIGKIKNDS